MIYPIIVYLQCDTFQNWILTVWHLPKIYLPKLYIIYTVTSTEINVTSPIILYLQSDISQNCTFTVWHLPKLNTNSLTSSKIVYLQSDISHDCIFTNVPLAWCLLFTCKVVIYTFLWLFTHFCEQDIFNVDISAPNCILNSKFPFLISILLNYLKLSLHVITLLSMPLALYLHFTLLAKLH